MAIVDIMGFLLAIVFIIFIAIRFIRFLFKKLRTWLFRVELITIPYKWWVKQKPFYHKFLRNITVGIIIELVLQLPFVHDFPLIRQSEDAAFDWVMSISAGTTSAQLTAKQSPELAFLDIDEAAYRYWKEPLHIPRDELLGIIDYAVKGKPKLIVVDVDLSKPDLCRNHDAELFNYLNEYHDDVPIILPQLFREPVKGESRRTKRDSFFGENRPYSDDVAMASPLFELDEKDLRLRRWRLWEIDIDNQATPSVELLAVALLNSKEMKCYKDSGEAIVKVNEKLTKLNQKDSLEISICGINLKKNPEDISQRIIYSIPWNIEEGGVYPNNFTKRSVLPIIKNLSHTLDNKIGAQSTTAYSSQFTTSNKVKTVNSINAEWLKEKVVVIGASFRDSRDFYTTPIGPMPGSMVIVNAINSLYLNQQVNRISGYSAVLWEIAFVVIISFVFAKSESLFIAMLVCSSVIIVGLMPFSFIYFKQGVWLDFAIPTFAIYLNQLEHELESMRKGLK